ncbi:hypothetical protein [Fodinicola feengrottensis]|uniref:hypothetical protein n=1 Tax=Fodinicola feengrottensis TaxID=435914 RepID=UPI00244249FE|nr:hypothetical protein [Fodinicola feengrottensis]
MSDFGDEIARQLATQPKFARALHYAIDHCLVDLIPWVLFTSDSQISTRSKGINEAYTERHVLCFAERRDTDDVGCVVLESTADYAAGEVLIIHDFASPGWEVDVSFSDFWGGSEQPSTT